MIQPGEQHILVNSLTFVPECILCFVREKCEHSTKSPKPNVKGEADEHSKAKVEIPASSRKVDYITFLQSYSELYLSLPQKRKFCLNGICPSNCHSLINSVQIGLIEQVPIIILINSEWIMHGWCSLKCASDTFPRIRTSTQSLVGMAPSIRAGSKENIIMVKAIVSYFTEQLPYPLFSAKHFTQRSLLNRSNNPGGRYLPTDITEAMPS